MYCPIGGHAVANFVDEYSQPHCSPDSGLLCALPALSTMLNPHHTFLEFGKETSEFSVLNAIDKPPAVPADTFACYRE
jgi:hypothetical protein